MARQKKTSKFETELERRRKREEASMQIADTEEEAPIVHAEELPASLPVPTLPVPIKRSHAGDHARFHDVYVPKTYLTHPIFNDTDRWARLKKQTGKSKTQLFNEAMTLVFMKYGAVDDEMAQVISAFEFD